MEKSSRKPPTDSHARARLRVTCENCGADLVAGDSDAGKKATCPECGTSLTIPSLEDRAFREGLESLGEQKTPDDQAKKPVSQSARRRKSERSGLLENESIVIEPGPESDTIPLEYGVAPPSAEERAAASAPMTAGGLQGVSGELTTGSHESRAKLAGLLRRMVIVVIALAVVQIFAAICAAVVSGRPPVSLPGALAALRDAVATFPANLRLLTVIRPVEVGMIAPFERFFLGLIMLGFAARLVVRTKLLDAFYVTTSEWNERSNGGLVFHFLALVLQAGILAWAASVVKTPAASDGLACGLLALLLLVSAIWLVALHLVARNEYSDLVSWLVTDGLFGFAILVVVICPGVTLLWSRAGATVVLCLVNLALALHFGASFVFARRPRGWWWRKPLFLVVSILTIIAAAVLLACVR